MHILGLANGSIGGNSEILLKAALLAAQKSDPSITISWIHIPSAHVPRNPKPLKKATEVSNGLVAITGENTNGNGVAPLDDRQAILDAILDADALIFASPTYSHQPAGALKAVTDKILGPFADGAVARRTLQRKAAGDPEVQDSIVDERLLKPKQVGFMMVAGSTVPDQVTMALPTMHQFVYPLHAKVVDQYVFLGCANPGSVLLDPERTISRAEQLGRNVASQLGKQFDEAQYLGPHKEGNCPYCHLNTVQLDYNSANEVGCLTCGARGKLAVREDGQILPTWDPDCGVSCITMKGKMKHLDDIAINGKKERPGLPGIKEKHEAWNKTEVPKVKLSTW